MRTMSASPMSLMPTCAASRIAELAEIERAAGGATGRGGAAGGRQAACARSNASAKRRSNSAAAKGAACARSSAGSKLSRSKRSMAAASPSAVWVPNSTPPGTRATPPAATSASASALAPRPTVSSAPPRP